jgi:hypothetical protein
MTQSANLAALGSNASSTGTLGASSYASATIPNSALSGNPTFRNRIINGNMMIDQRNAGASVTPSSGQTYLIDRFCVYNSQASKYTSQQNAGSVTPPSGYTNYLGLTSSSAYSITSTDIFMLQQRIEGYNVADLGWGTANAQPVTLSFWVRSSLTGTFGGSITNNGSGRCYPFTYAISSANTWEQKTITIAGDTTGTWNKTNSIGLYVIWGLGVGSTYSGTAGSWSSSEYYSATGGTSFVGTNGATFYITGVQLEAGSAASPFENRLYGTELALCQRYYYVHASDANKPISLGSYANSTYVEGYVVFKSTMRANPTLVTVSGTNYYGIYRAGSADTFDSFGLDAAISTNTAIIYNSTQVSGTGGQVGNMYTNNASSLIAFTAEL